MLFSGTWSAKDVKEALGDNYAATSLPTFTVNGQKKQMKSFAATKAAAYNPNAKNPKAAAQFAAYLAPPKLRSCTTRCAPSRRPTSPCPT